MSGKKKKMIRSHRSRRRYKPMNKAILNREAKTRRIHNRMLDGMFKKSLQAWQEAWL